MQARLMRAPEILIHLQFLITALRRVRYKRRRPETINLIMIKPSQTLRYPERDVYRAT